MNTTELQPLIPVTTIAKWLPEIFSEGTPNRNYVVRDMSAKTIFVMLYIGAIEGTSQWLRPDQVTKMTDEQASRADDESRNNWRAASTAPGAMKDLAGRWYASNTREPIRDETLRSGLVSLGAVIERTDLPTTSAKPRYAIARSFAELLLKLSHTPENSGSLVSEWQTKNLTASALTRINLMRRGAIHLASSDRIKVAFPNGETRLMRPGPSTIITKAVVEEFASKFLREPGVIFLSESGDKVIARDEALSISMGLRLDYSKNLPDIILADVFPGAAKLVFIEVVATDGAVNENRKQSLLRVASEAGFKDENVFFVSAFLDRNAPAFRKLACEIAWGTFVWFTSEPDKLLVFREGESSELSSLLVR